jgi:error-prone DNA polymerase
MVHPYLRRREGKEKVDYQGRSELKKILEKTLGVPLFQEQAMRIAIDCAGFTPDEADSLRRSMATFRHNGDVDKHRARFMTGMAKNGYDQSFAERCFKQIEGFGNYGFPESHAASFALLAYVSAWLKCHHPAIFAAALLNSQPMGFYAPAQIVRDAVEHGVEVLPVDVNLSNWDCTLESIAAPDGRVTPGHDVSFNSGVSFNRVTPGHDVSFNSGISFNSVMPGLDPGISGKQKLALRLGFRQAKGVAEKEIAKLLAARGDGYRNAEQLWRRGGLELAALTRLAEADAFRSMGLDRRQALWAVRGLGEAPLPLFAAQENIGPEDITDGAALPVMPLSQHVIEDYRALQMTLKRHPLAFLRARMERRGVTANKNLSSRRNGEKVTVAGLVLVRQRPGTASGVIFMTMEDETGIANLVVWKHMFELHRRVIMTGKLVACRGKLQIEGKPPHQVIHVVAEQLTDWTPLLSSLREENVPPEEAGFAIPYARADEVMRHPPRPDPRDPSPDPWDATPVLDIRSRDFH